ncbi:hypothetical protein DXG01_002733 [Tephrocybe rancida]|nr:hypothetical protein DXG01_002733 [Tephrocybe rancida]
MPNWMPEGLCGKHGVANAAAIVLKAIDCFNLHKKLGWMTGDNVAVNDGACHCCGRCMEHTVHLGVKVFIEALYPSKKKGKKHGDTTDDSNDSNNDSDSGQVDLSIIPDTDEINDAITFEASDLIGKVLALINQVCASPQAKAYFKTICKEEGLTPLQLIKWVRTWWGSMLDLVNHVVENKAALNKFCLLVDASSKVLNLRNKEYHNYYISEEEWVLLNLIKTLLQEPHDVQSVLSSEKVPTAWKTLPILEYLIE